MLGGKRGCGRPVVTLTRACRGVRRRCRRDSKKERVERRWWSWSWEVGKGFAVVVAVAVAVGRGGSSWCWCWCWSMSIISSEAWFAGEGVKGV